MATNHNDDGVDWEGIGRTQLERSATRTADDVETSIRLLGQKIGAGIADTSNLVEARQAIEAAINVVEDDLAPAVPGDTGRGPTRYIHTDGAATEYLGLTTGQANEARAGATVQVGTDDLRRLCNGQSVHVETAAGIEIEVQPKTLGDSEAGP